MLALAKMNISSIDPIAKEQCRLNLVSSSPTPLTGNMPVGVGE